MPPIKEIKVNSIGITASQCMHFDETKTLQRSDFAITRSRINWERLIYLHFIIINVIFPLFPRSNKLWWNLSQERKMNMKLLLTLLMNHYLILFARHWFQRFTWLEVWWKCPIQNQFKLVSFLQLLVFVREKHLRLLSHQM